MFKLDYWNDKEQKWEELTEEEYERRTKEDDEEYELRRKEEWYEYQNKTTVDDWLSVLRDRRTAPLLMRAGIHTLADLRRTDEKDIAAIRGIGPKRFALIMKVKLTLE